MFIAAAESGNPAGHRNPRRPIQCSRIMSKSDELPSNTSIRLPSCVASCIPCVADRQAWPFAAALRAAWFTSICQKPEFVQTALIRLRKQVLLGIGRISHPKLQAGARSSPAVWSAGGMRAAVAPQIASAGPCRCTSTLRYTVLPQILNTPFKHR